MIKYGSCTILAIIILALVVNLYIVHFRSHPPVPLSDSVLLHRTINQFSSLRKEMDDLKAFHISQHMNTDHEYPQEIKYGEGDNEKYLFPIKLVAENTVSMNMIEQNRLIDPFQENSKESRESNKGRDKEFQYLSNGKWYMFISAGPDRLYETDYIKYVINNKSNILMEDAMKLSVTMSYDPTNGAKSRGDYLLIGGSTVQNISAE